MPHIKHHKRINLLSKIISFSCIFLILYIIFINCRPVTNNLEDNLAPKVEQYISTEHSGSSAIEHRPNSEISILYSVFEGVNKNLNPYIIKAKQARKTLKNKYELDTIFVQYNLNKQQDLIINSNTGILNEETKFLILTDKVQFNMGEAVFNTEKAEINLLNKEAFSNAGIILSYKNSKITSNNFNSKNDNNIINFNDRVRATIDLSNF